MKRLLAFLLCAVMLFSVLGAEAWAADGDTLTVYTKSGGRRNVTVGETFTYTYSLRIFGIYDLDRIRLDVVFDPECVEYMSVEYPSFTSGEARETSKAEANRTGDLHVEKGLITNGGSFSQSIMPLITVTFKAKRAGTTYIRTLPQRIEVEAARESDIYFIENYRPSASRNALFSTYDYLGDNAPTGAASKLDTSQDVIWFYMTDKATGERIEAGQTFALRGTDEDGRVVNLTATTDEYGYLCFPKVPYGRYSLSCTSLRADGSAWFVEDSSVPVPMLNNLTLALRSEVQVRALQPDEMRDIRINLLWADEYIDTNVKYENDRPANVSLELEAGGVQYAHPYLAASERTILLEHMPRTDADGNELNYELIPGVTDHYTSEVLPTDEGFNVTLRYLNDHDWSSVRTEPDCDKNGEVVYTCDDCGAIYHYTLAPLGHDYAISGYDATCEKDGYHLYVCKRCGKWYAETIEAAGHVWGAWVVDIPATETEDGTRHRTCTVCGEREEGILKGPNHQHGYSDHVVAPTCTEGGYTEKVCGCGDSFVVEGSRTPALGHDYTGDSSTRTVIENSCTKEGVIEYTCTRCHEMHAEILPAHGHNYEVVEFREATCTESGYTLSECAWCGDQRNPRTAALGHDYGDWIIDVPATSTMPGTKHRVCRRCLQEEIVSIPVSGQGHVHHYDISETVAPTCTERGFTRYVCPDDGATFIDTDTYSDALGHDWSESWRTDSTARTRGVICFECGRCGVLRYESLPKQDGVWRNGFWDVVEDDWFFDAVRYVAYNDYMNGTSTTRFEPNSSMTRAMLVTVLYRMVGSPSVRGLTMPFHDVPDGSDVWFHDAVLWAYDTGVVDGVSETEFAPYMLITREQMVTIFHRYANYAGYDTSDITTLMGFADALYVSDYARGALAWAVKAGIVDGIEENGVNYLQPQGTATRAQAAAIIQRFDAWRLS